MNRPADFGLAAATLALVAFTATAVAADPLPSWNRGPTRSAVVAFVELVTKEGGPDFVPAAERIAVFDNDGTLWPEQPAYVQVAFARDRIKRLVEEHPEWRDRPLFKAAIEGDMRAIHAGSPRDR